MRNNGPEWAHNGRRDGALSLAILRTKVGAFAALYDCEPSVRIDTEWKHGLLKTIGRKYLTVRVAATEWRREHDEKWDLCDVWYVTIRVMHGR